MTQRILIGIPPKNHVNLAMDEVEGLKAIGYTCKTITYTRNQPFANKLDKLFGVLRNAFAIIKMLKQFTPHILYLNSRFEPVGTTRDFITILLIRTLYWHKLHITIKTHGSDFSIFTKPNTIFNKVIIPYLHKEVALWFFLSQEEKDVIMNYAPLLAKKVYVTGNIIDPKRSKKSHTFLEKHGLNDSRFKFFFAGRMVAEKGIFSIIRAIPSFKYKEDCLFIFAGNGEDYEMFKHEIEDKQLEKYTHLTGFLPENECDHFYANVDALVFPTYFNEGFPMTLFKSIACGLPIITTKTRAAKDHLHEPDNCLWVNGQDPESVLHALITIYENKELRKKMTQTNLGLGQLFSKEKITQQMHQDFLKILTTN